MIFGRRFPPPFVQRRPQAAESKPQPPSWGGGGPQPAGGAPNPRRPGGIVPPRPGVGQGAGPGGLWPPERRPEPAQREPRAGPRQGAAPTPPPGRWGAPAGGGRVRRRRGTDAGKAANPTPRRPQPATGPPPHGRAPRRGGCGPPHPGGQQRDRTQADHGPGAPPPATSPHQRRRGPTGRGRTRPGRCDWGGGGRAGPVPARPAPDRPHTLAGPARHLWGRAGHRHGGGPGRRALCARDSGRAEGPRGGRIRSRGHPSRSWGGVGGKKNAGKLAPPAGQRLDEKNAGRTLCPPPLAVTADTRFPPVRRSSPKRTRCRPVPYALVVRRLLGLRSCVP